MKPAKGTKIHKHHFKLPTAHFHCQFPISFLISRQIGQGQEDCAQLPGSHQMYLSISLVPHMRNWPKDPCEMLGHHGTPQISSPQAEGQKSPLYLRQSAILNQMPLSSCLNILCGEDPTTEHAQKRKHMNPSYKAGRNRAEMTSEIALLH